MGTNPPTDPYFEILQKYATAEHLELFAEVINKGPEALKDEALTKRLSQMSQDLYSRAKPDERAVIERAYISHVAEARAKTAAVPLSTSATDEIAKAGTEAGETGKNLEAIAKEADGVVEKSKDWVLSKLIDMTPMPGVLKDGARKWLVEDVPVSQLVTTEGKGLVKGLLPELKIPFIG